MERRPSHGGSSIMAPKTEEIKVKIKVDRQELDDTMEELKESTDNRPRITIRNNKNVYVTINNFNETEKEYMKSVEEAE